MTETVDNLSAIFDEHVADEFVAKDVAATMATIARNLCRIRAQRCISLPGSRIRAPSRTAARPEVLRGRK
jgi:hypothetical protein